MPPAPPPLAAAAGRGPLGTAETAAAADVLRAQPAASTASCAGFRGSMSGQQQPQKQGDAHAHHRAWPVSLLGCMDASPASNQAQWPWLLLKGSLCPAALLGANETLFQGEALADICCLQPYSACGPTCRSLNTELCGLGNDGLKLCASTCLMQALCSCFCLGLPYVAWLSALQRQRVMAKHGVAASEEDAWAAACFPCSLMQMYTLLQQQQHGPQQQQPLYAGPLRAPKVQQMVHTSSAAASGSEHQPAASCTSHSHAGPLTSALTSSKALRGLHSARSDCSGAAGSGAQPRPPQQGSSDAASSEAGSETGVVNSPLPGKQLRPPEGQVMPGVDGGDSSSNSSRRTTPRPHVSSNGAANAGSGSSRGSSNSGGAQAAAATKQQPVGPLTSARSHGASSGGGGQQPPALPPRPGRARHVRTASLGSGGADCSPEAAVSPGGGVQQDRQHQSGTSRGLSVQASQSCQLPHGFHSSAKLQDAAAAAAVSQSPPPAATAATSSSAQGPPRLLFGTAAVGGSCSKLLQASQEDVPLFAQKPTPGRASRVTAASLRSSTGAGAGGSMQQQATPPPAGGSPEQQQQYATVQSDICNFASWLGTAASPSISTTQQAPRTEELEPPAQQASDDDLCMLSPSAADLGSPAACSSQQQASAAGEDSSSSSCGGSRPGQPAAAADEERGGSGSGSATPVAGAAASGRPHMLSAAWAYMSDMCNLGGSFDGGSSRLGLAAALGRLAEEGGSQDSSVELLAGDGEAAAAAEGGASSSSGLPAATAAPGAGAATPVQRPGSGRKEQQLRSAAAAGLAAGSWPDTAPSPAHATLNGSNTGNSMSAGGTPGAAATAASSSMGDQEVCSSSSTDSKAAEGGEAASNAGRREVAGSGRGSRPTGRRDDAAGPSACGPNTHDLDPRLLAAVTGTADREQLTASQEQLATKLARLAFANPGVAKQVAGAQQPQQQPQPQQQQPRLLERLEPFYPTVMSDVCNLGDVDNEGQAAEADLPALISPKSSGAAETRSNAAARKPSGSLQQQQQAPATTSRLRPTSAAAGAPVDAAAAPCGAASPAAGPLRTAMLLRGLRQPPGGAQQVMAPVGALTAAARRLSSAAAAGGDAGCPHLHAAAAAEDSVASFDSFYHHEPDAEAKGSSAQRRDSRVAGGQVVVAGAGTPLTDNPLFNAATLNTEAAADSPRVVDSSPTRRPRHLQQSSAAAGGLPLDASRRGASPALQQLGVA